MEPLSMCACVCVCVCVRRRECKCRPVELIMTSSYSLLCPETRMANGCCCCHCPPAARKKKSLSLVPTVSVCVCFRKWRVSEMCSNLTSMRQETAAAAKHKKDTQERKKREFHFFKTVTVSSRVDEYNGVCVLTVLCCVKTDEFRAD